VTQEVVYNDVPPDYQGSSQESQSQSSSEESQDTSDVVDEDILNQVGEDEMYQEWRTVEEQPESRRGWRAYRDESLVLSFDGEQHYGEIVTVWKDTDTETGEMIVMMVFEEEREDVPNKTINVDGRNAEIVAEAKREVDEFGRAKGTTYQVKEPESYVSDIQKYIPKYIQKYVEQNDWDATANHRNDVLEKIEDEYVGDSRGLGRERARLSTWHKNRPSGMRSYASMTDRLFSLGIEEDLDDKVLRVMTPYDDDSFNEYVSQIRSLLNRGFKLRLLTRHTKSSWEWKRLQRELLSEIKEHRDLVTLRTYSRFKTHQRVTPGMDFKQLGEFGIHGKLQTIGNPEEGAVLLGSANFIENSYDWNPECGVYTERNQFVEAAIEFFDIVWDISEADELSISRLQELPDNELVPTYYS